MSLPITTRHTYNKATVFPNPAAGFGASTLDIRANGKKLVVAVPTGDDHKNMVSLNKKAEQVVTVDAPNGFDAGKKVVVDVGDIKINGTVICGTLEP